MRPGKSHTPRRRPRRPGAALPGAEAICAVCDLPLGKTIPVRWRGRTIHPGCAPGGDE